MRTEPINLTYFNFKANDEGNVKEKVVSKPDVVVSEPPKKNALPLITAAVAIASLGVSAIALTRGSNKTPEAGIDALKAEIEKLQKELKNQMSAPEITGKINELTNKLNELTDRVNQVNKDELLRQINSLRESLSGIASQSASKGAFPSTLVNVNGRDFALANILNPLQGAERENFHAALQSEAAHRMFGLSEGLKQMPEHAVMRIPTSEFKGFASTGGMAAVPKEIADNIAKLVAGKQNVSIVVDIPLYRGAVEKSSVKTVYTEKFNDIIPQSDGTYRYIQNTIKTENGKQIDNKTDLIANLKKINSMDVRILSDSAESVQKVDMYMAERKIPLDYKVISENSSPKVKEIINSMKPNETRNWGTLVLEKDKDGNVKAFANIRTILYDNGKGGKFDLNVPIDKTSNIYNDVAIASGETERFVYFSKFFYENIAKAETARENYLREAETISGKIAKEKNQDKINSLQQQRQKLLDEANGQLGADLILGNDWQSGPISVMMRQLTTAKKYYGDLNKNVAEKLHSTPIVTIIHNAELTGRNWNSQAKLLNVLFGEHAAEIVENSHMPNLFVKNQNAGLSSNLWNGLMEGTDVNPQMMAIAYSDVLVPVSDGYAKEIASIYEFGKDRVELFKFRARIGYYNEVENLRQIAAQNGIKISEIKSVNPTMIGITNGADRANNTLTASKAREIERNLNLPENTFVPYQPGTDKLEWHNKNKMVALQKMKDDINAARNLENPKNPMQIEMPLETDLTGVTEKTPVFVSAGRIVDQKGLDILAESMKEFYKGYKGSEYPVFYIQGIGDAKYKEAILDAKREIAKTNPEAAKRIVFANLFSEPGRFDLSKLITDWSLMPSWFEPCGLSHKEIGMFSGAGSIVNKTGGLAADLQEGLNVIVSDFNPARDNIGMNAQNYAKAIQAGVDMHADDNKFRSVVESMMTANFDWAREGGPIYSYKDIFNKLGFAI